MPDGSAAERPWTAPDFRSLTDGVWTATVEPAGATVGLVVGSQGCLLVDCGSSPAHGAAIRDAVATVTDRPLVAVVVTHAHWDHAYGLAAFGDGSRPEVSTVAHSSVWPATVAELGADGVAERGLVPPTRPIALALALDLGDCRIEVAHLGHGHTAGDLVVVVPDADVVFAGDLLESAGPPWFGADSFPAEWPATLDGVIGLLGDGSRVVPGHGPVMDREAVFTQRSELAAVAGELRRLATEGVPLDQAAEQGRWPYPVEHVAGGIAVGYREVGPVSPRRSLPLA